VFDGAPLGFANTQIAIVWGHTEEQILADMRAQGLLPNDWSEQKGGSV
jgi:hypothetical protein